MFNFSDETKRILIANGWFEQRNVDISEYLNLLNERGKPITEIVLNFLKSFYGLTIYYPSKINSNILMSFSINPLEGGELDSQIIDKYEKEWVQKPLISIGTNNENELLMSLDGEIFAAFDSWIVKLGNSVEAAIYTLCYQKNGEIIQKIN